MVRHMKKLHPKFLKELEEKQKREDTPQAPDPFRLAAQGKFPIYFTVNLNTHSQCQ
jgi:hypothetical protein